MKHGDDFDRYLHARRLEARATPETFWPDYLGALATVTVVACVVGGACVLAPHALQLIGAK